MGLSHDLVSQFAKIVNKDMEKPSETTVYGTVVTDGEGNKYVKLDGSDQLTPITNTSSSVKADERVSVLIKDHNATVTGNLSSPSVRTGDFNDLNDQVTDIKQFDLVIADRVEANEVSIGDLNAATANITELVNKKASIEQLNADKAEITDLIAAKIDAKVANAEFATIKKNLKAATADIDDLQTKNITIENRLTAHDATITNLKTTYAQIDFSNIGMAAVEKLFTKSGIIKDLHVGDTSITGKLVGVTIKGDLIEGNTIKADKLVVKGSDGLFYKLNTDGITTTAEQTAYDSLNGSVIMAKTITAKKVNVNDLSAFEATIGGFQITDDSLYSGVKASSDNTTRGIFLGNDGQFVVGDRDNFLKFYKDSKGIYKLALSADSMIFSSSGKSVESDINDIKGSMDDRFKEIGVYIRTDADGMELGKEGSPSQLRIDNDSIIFLDNGEPISEWTRENFHTGNILVDVLERAQFGNFAFVPRSDGSLSFLKVNNYMSGNLFNSAYWSLDEVSSYTMIGQNGIELYAKIMDVPFVDISNLDHQKKYELSCNTNGITVLFQCPKQTESQRYSYIEYENLKEGHNKITFTGTKRIAFYFLEEYELGESETAPSDWDEYAINTYCIYNSTTGRYEELRKYYTETPAWESGKYYRIQRDDNYPKPTIVRNIKIMEVGN